MRKALIVGVNFYESVNNLPGCVSDAYSVDSVLKDNSDGTRNFDTKLITAVDENSKVTRAELKRIIKELFDDDSDIALFYYSGHGYIESTGGYLLNFRSSK